MKNLLKKNQLMITALAIMIAIAGYLQFAGNNLKEERLTVEDADAASTVDSGGVITDNYIAGKIGEEANAGEGIGLEEALPDGVFDLSEEDLLGLTEIESLDGEPEDFAEDYLEEGMQIAQVQADGQAAGATPDQNEIPGEAVFTSTTGYAILADAKLLKEQTRAKNKETLMEIINSDGLGDEQKQDAVNTMVGMTAVAEKESAAEILLEAKGFSDVVVSINGNAADVVVNAAALNDAQRAQIEDIVKRKTGIAAENIIISTVVE